MKLLQFPRPEEPRHGEEPVGRALLAELDSLYRTARRLAGSADIAEDLVQETARKALQHRTSLRDSRRIRSWLFKILVNATRDYLRRKRVREEVRAEREEPESVAELRSVSHATVQDVRRALATVAPERRALVVLIDVEGFTIAEAAEMLKLPVGTAASRLARARKDLRRLLAAYGSEPAHAGGQP